MSDVIINMAKRAPWGFRRGFVKQLVRGFWT